MTIGWVRGGGSYVATPKVRETQITNQISASNIWIRDVCSFPAPLVLGAKHVSNQHKKG